jgi:hypothetical protein
MLVMFVRRTAPALAAALLCLYAAPVAAASPAGSSTGASVTSAGMSRAAAAAPAKSSGSYRYWSFWQQKTKGTKGTKGKKEKKGKKGKTQDWAFATKGPASLRPHDGDVIGFRFALSSDAQDAAKPRGASDFDSICGDTGEKAGRKRVALNVDFGVRAHAPHGEKPPKRRTACARVPENATAADALSVVAEPLRYDSHAVLRSVHGYPRQGGSGRESGKDGAAGDVKDGGGGLSSGVGIGVGAAAVVALAAAATWQVRRRR